MELAQLVTVAGAAGLVVILVEAEKRAFAMTAALVDRLGLAMAIANGLLVTVPTALYIGADPASAIVAGILAGASSVGLYQAVAASPLPTYVGEGG